jgi:uncharacterized protein YllA (UPF0747 family)
MNPVHPLTLVALEDFQSKWGSSDLQRQNLKKLKSGANVVLTGQQPSLMGGPAYNLYKAYTALTEAQKSDSVAIFWIASDDSDLAECNFFESIQSQSQFKFKFENPNVAMCLSERIFTQKHAQEWDEFKAKAVGFENSKITVGQSLADHFSEILQNTLGSTGILFLDARHPKMIEAAQDFLKNVHAQSDDLNSILSQNALAFSAKKVPVSIDPLKSRIFEVKNGIRERILADQNLNSSMTFSHDVLSRPLLASALLPISAHVLGPGELKYFELLVDKNSSKNNAFELFGLHTPKRIPRLHHTHISPTAQEFLNLISIDTTQIKSIHWNELNQKAVEHFFPDFIHNNIFEVSSKWSTLDHKNIDQQLQNIIQKTQNKHREKLLKTLLKSHKSYPQVLSIYNEFAQGRIQERHWFCSSRWGEILAELDESSDN